MDKPHNQRMPHICWGKIIFSISLSIAYSNAAFATVISSTFDNGAEDWTGVGAVSISWQSSGGNPGGYLRFDDTGPDGYRAAAPGAFLGDLSIFNQGTFSFDYRVLNNTPGNPDFAGIVRIYSSTGGFATADLIPSLSSSTTSTNWATYSLPLVAPLWGIILESEWQELLADVAWIDISMEPGDFPDASALDNVILSSASSPPVDEPATLALLGLGLAGIGFARKKTLA